MSCEKELWKQYYDLDRSSPDPSSPAKIDFYQKYSERIRSVNSSVTSPEAAIVVCAHNEERYLPLALATINQALFGVSDGCEILVVDNASTDATKEIIQEFGAKVIDEPRKGIGSARQAGLYATSESCAYVLTTDADTAVPEKWIGLHLKALGQEAAAMSFGYSRLQTETKLTILEKIATVTYECVAEMNKRIKQLVPKRGFAASCNMAYHREYALMEGGYNTELARGEDIDLMLKLQKHGLAIYVPQSTVRVSNRRLVSQLQQDKFIELVLSRISSNLRFYINGKGLFGNEYSDHRLLHRD
ncbi:MAG: glycosyltransferase family 2 protein [Patescibacteria group bacterium]|jgi:glycosyltransferase involved in cell wall biosynthesis